jgi:hypothetical protein
MDVELTVFHLVPDLRDTDIKSINILYPVEIQCAHGKYE